MDTNRLNFTIDCIVLRRTERSRCAFGSYFLPKQLMLEVRTPADVLEQEVADELWPLPKYREMLFLR